MHSRLAFFAASRQPLNDKVLMTCFQGLSQARRRDPRQVGYGQPQPEIGLRAR
jgi:hypothetical protein